MAMKRTRPRDDAPIVRSSKDVGHGGTRHLPPQFDRLAAGEDRLSRPPRGPDHRVRDPRERVLIPGTNNRDSRGLYDRRLADLRALLSQGDMQNLASGLLDFLQLGLFRARNVVDMDAFSTSVLGIPLEQARQLLSAAATARGVGPERLPESLIALWIRTEAALREHTPHARVALVGSGEQTQLQIALPCHPLGAAVDALAALGRQAAGLGRHLPPAPQRPLESRGEPRHDSRNEPLRHETREGTDDRAAARERRPTVPMRSQPPRRPPTRSRDDY